MKFLCVSCDEPMTLKTTTMHEDQGSLSVVYGCPKCDQQTAMLTNRGETQLVTSLGVKIGPDGEKKQTESKCPFSSMLAGGEKPAAEATEEEDATATIPTGAAPGGPAWTAEATARLELVPEFVRPMAKMGIEQYASQHGHGQITVDVLDKAKAQFGF